MSIGEKVLGGGIYVAIPMGEKYNIAPHKVQQALVSLFSRFLGQLFPVGLNHYWRFTLNTNRPLTREEMVQEAIKGGFKWIWWVDDDVIVPNNAVLTLFNREVDIAAGLVCTRTEPPQPLIFDRRVEGPVKGWEPGSVVRCDGAGFGCTLMRTEIFQKLDPPWFVEDRQILKDDEGKPWTYGSTEDLPLMYRAVDAGFKMYVDTSVNCLHLDWQTGRVFGWDQKVNAPFSQFEDERRLFVTAEKEEELRKAEAENKIEDAREGAV